MTALVDARPPGVDVGFRPGTTLTVTLSWPAGSLAGRTFTSTLDGDALTVTVAGDTMTVEASDTQTAALAAGGPVIWLLSEELGGAAPEPIMVGTWSPSTRPSAVSQQAVTVTQGGVDVDVSALGASLLSSGREVAGPSQQEASSVSFNANLGAFQVQDVLTSGGAMFHEITVPPGLLRPVWLELDTSVQNTVAGAAVGLAIVPSGTASPALITSAIQHRIKSLPTANRNEHLGMRVRLAAGVSGSYKVMGGVIGGGLGTISAADSGPSILSAIEH